MEEILEKNAYKEVFEIIKYLPDEQRKLIPEDVIDNLEKLSNQEFVPNIDPNKLIEEQEISDYGKILLIQLYREYIIKDNAKELEKWEKYDRINDKILEEEKKAKYDVNVFKKANKIVIEDNNDSNTIQIIKYEEESLFKKIMNIFKNLFKFGRKE